VTSVRDLRPTDIVAFAAFEAKAAPNLARIRERLQLESRGPLFLNALIEPWLPTESRRTVVAAEGLAIRGLASARQRRRSTVWEVDWLVVGDEAERGTISIQLLELMVTRCAEAGAHRVFLRVPREGIFVDAARRASFWPYASETVFVRPAAAKPTMAAVPEGLRQRGKTDDYALFRLYSAVVPSAVRSAEGMTLDEWSAGQEATPGKRREFVVTHEDTAEAWVWVSRSHGNSQISLIAAKDDETSVNHLVQFALTQCGRHDRVVALVPDFQSGLQFALRADWGFEEVAHYQTLIRHLPVRVAQPAFLPARA